MTTIPVVTAKPDSTRPAANSSTIGLTVWTLLLAAACQQSASSPTVDFSQSTQQIGRWAEHPAPQSGAPQQAAAAVSSSPSQPTAAAPATPAVSASAPAAPAVAASAPPGAATMAQKAPAGPAATSTPSAGAAGAPAAATGSPAATSAPSADVEAPKAAVSSVSYTFTSVTYNGKYKPRNVGAIWVETPDGKLVKSLEVWSWLRSRYLERYAQARNGALVDVTSGATLSRHGPHMASWDLADVNGSKAAPGKYLLWIEISEDDGPGKTSSVELDTSKGPATIDVPDAPGISMLKVQLH